MAAFYAENGNLELALEVIQLGLKLLLVERRDQLQKLLSFMALAADPQAMKLHKEVRMLSSLRGFQRQ